MNRLNRPVNRLIAATVLVAAIAVPLAGCSKSDSSASTTTAKNSQVLPPTILGPAQTTATVKVGTVVTFNLGNPEPGKYIAKSDDPKVFEIISTGGSQGAYTTNAGGKAIATGTANVTVQLEGSATDASVPTIVTYTITVV